MMHEMSFENTQPPPRPRLLFGEPADLNDIPDEGTERLEVTIEVTSTDRARAPFDRLSSNEIFPSDRPDREASDHTRMQLGAPPGVSHKVSPEFSAISPSPRAFAVD
jgi:hypothetical protein